MAPRLSVAALALAAAAFLPPIAARAECLTASSGARCIRVLDVPERPLDVSSAAMTSASTATALVGVGDVLPRGRYSIILNADYYGLPPVSDGWVYMRVGHDAFRVHWRTHEVLERVTDRVAANF